MHSFCESAVQRTLNITSATEQPELASTHRLEAPEAVDQFEVGHEVRLFILFDRPTASEQSSLSEIPTTTRSESAECGLVQAGGYHACTHTRRFGVRRPALDGIAKPVRQSRRPARSSSSINSE